LKDVNLNQKLRIGEDCVKFESSWKAVNTNIIQKVFCSKTRQDKFMVNKLLELLCKQVLRRAIKILKNVRGAKVAKRLARVLAILALLCYNIMGLFGLNLITTVQSKFKISLRVSLFYIERCKSKPELKKKLRIGEDCVKFESSWKAVNTNIIQKVFCSKSIQKLYSFCHSLVCIKTKS